MMITRELADLKQSQGDLPETIRLLRSLVDTSKESLHASVHPGRMKSSTLARSLNPSLRRVPNCAI